MFVIRFAHQLVVCLIVQCSVLVALHDLLSDCVVIVSGDTDRFQVLLRKRLLLVTPVHPVLGLSLHQLAAGIDHSGDVDVGQVELQSDYVPDR